MPNQQTVEDLLNLIRSDASASADIKQKAEKVFGEIAAASVLQSDVWIYRLVVIVLGIAVLATIIGGLGLAFMGSTNYKLPAELVAIGSAAVGALAGLLAPSPREQK